MEHSAKDRLTDRLITVVRDLPADKVSEVVDFADYLQTKYAAPLPPRGSVEAILHALDQAGPLQFEPDELESLLADLQALRELDDDNLPA